MGRQRQPSTDINPRKKVGGPKMGGRPLRVPTSENFLVNGCTSRFRAFLPNSGELEIESEGRETWAQLS